MRQWAEAKRIELARLGTGADSDRQIAIQNKAVRDINKVINDVWKGNTDARLTVQDVAGIKYHLLMYMKLGWQQGETQEGPWSTIYLTVTKNTSHVMIPSNPGNPGSKWQILSEKSDEPIDINDSGDYHNSIEYFISGMAVFQVPKPPLR